MTARARPEAIRANDARADYIKTLVRRRYDYMARESDFPPDAVARAVRDGYAAADLAPLPEIITAAYAGCGYPLAGIDLSGVAIAVDLGCGAGLDAITAAAALDPGAQLIALDFAPAMLRRLSSAGADNIKIVAADMEALPLASGIADLVLANASFNLTAAPETAFAEAYRILKPGGRLATAEFVREGPLPPEAAENPMASTASIGGILAESELRAHLGSVGFCEVEITGHQPAPPVTAIRISARRAR